MTRLTKAEYQRQERLLLEAARDRRPANVYRKIRDAAFRNHLIAMVFSEEHNDWVPILLAAGRAALQQEKQDRADRKEG